MQLTIDGETFRVEVEGADERPAVMLSPSLGTDLSLFDAQMPALLERFRVVRYDPRGHGGSTIAGAPYSLARLGRDALAILDALGIETAHFVGISMGGAVGQWLLVNAPRRIGRAVLANTAARLGTPETWNARIAAVLARGTQVIAPATMERWFSPAFSARAPAQVAAVDAVFRATGAEGYAGACAALRDMDLRAAIRSIDQPVLIVTGREDAVTSEADIATMMDAIRGARHVALDCRHISNVEQNAAFDAAVVGFLTAPMPARARPRKPPTRRRAGTGPASAARSPLKPPVAAAGGTKKARATPKAARGGKSTAPKTTASKKRPARKASGKVATRKPAAASKSTRKASAMLTPAKTPVSKTPVSKTPAAKKAAARKAAAKTAPAKTAAPKKSVARRPAATRRRPSSGGAGRRPER